VPRNKFLNIIQKQNVMTVMSMEFWAVPPNSLRDSLMFQMNIIPPSSGLKCVKVKNWSGNMGRLKGRYSLRSMEWVEEIVPDTGELGTVGRKIAFFSGK
jgi:hypothetical protein